MARNGGVKNEPDAKEVLLVRFGVWDALEDASQGI
jgi:hypothetical protein